MLPQFRYCLLLMLFICSAICALGQGNATPRKVLIIPSSCDPKGDKGDLLLWKITTPNQGLWTCAPATKVFVFQTNTFAASLTAKTMLYSNAAAAVFSTAAPTNGQVLIGDTGNIPALATLAGAANETLITNGAHSITIGLAATLKHKSGNFFQLTDSTDTTKIAQFDLSNITPGTTRTVNVSDANSTTVQGGAAVSNQFVTDVSPQGVVNRAQPTEANLLTSDITTNNVTSTKHGLAPKSPADATQFLNGAATPAFAAVKDSDLGTTDVTTNNVTSTKHGFTPKSPADATKFLNGAATAAFTQVNTTDLMTAVSGPLAGNGSSVAAATATQISAPVFCSDAGSTDAYACTLSPTISSYVTGTRYRFKANTANTGAASINLNALGAKTIVKVAGGITTTLIDNDIRAGQWLDIVYDGTNMQLQSTLGNAPVIAVGLSGGQTIEGGTGANDDLTLEGTSSGTRTTSYVIVQPTGGNTGVRTSNPTFPLTVSTNVTALPDNTLTAERWNMDVAMADGVPGGIGIDSFGSGNTNTFSVIDFRRANGTNASPGALQSGDIIGVLGGLGYGTTGYSGGAAQMRYLATETWSDTANGARVSILATPNGSTALAAVTETASFTATGVSLLGTTTNDSASTGRVGEYLSSTVASGSAISLTTDTSANVTSLSLTAGDWDVWGDIEFLSGASTTIPALTASLSTTSATADFTAGNFANLNYPAGTVLGVANSTVKVGPRRISIAATTTVYLVGRATFGTSTLTAWGILRARRVR